MSPSADPVAAATERLLSALARAHDGFTARDPAAASAALDGVLAACAVLDAAGARLDRATLHEAMALHRACAAAAVPVQQELSEKLQQCAGAHRAARAYAR